MLQPPGVGTCHERIFTGFPRVPISVGSEVCGTWWVVSCLTQLS